MRSVIFPIFIVNIFFFNSCKTREGASALAADPTALIDSAVTLSEDDGTIRSIAFSPDGQFLAWGSGVRNIKIWDIKAKKIISVLQLGAEDSVPSSIAFSPTDSLVATAGYGGKKAKIFDFKTGRLIRELFFEYEKNPDTARFFPVQSVAFSLDGKSIVTSGYDYPDLGKGVPTFAVPAIRSANMETWKESTLAMAGSRSGFLFGYSSKGTYIAARSYAQDIGEHKLHIVDALKGQSVATFVAPMDLNFQDKKIYKSIVSANFSPDEKTIAIGCKYPYEAEPFVILWDIAQQQVQKKIQDYKSLAYSPDGNLMVGIKSLQGGVNRKEKGFLDSLWIINASDGKEFMLREMPPVTEYSNLRIDGPVFAISPDGKTLATGWLDKTVRTYDLSSFNK